MARQSELPHHALFWFKLDDPLYYPECGSIVDELALAILHCMQFDP